VHLQLSQKQEFKLTAQLVASIGLMEIPLLDLRAKIAEELERNPALDIAEEPSDISFDENPPLPNEEDFYFETASDPGFVYRDGEEASDRQFQFIQGALTRAESLQERLLWQLRLEPIDEKIRALCEILIQNLDGDGFHLTPVEELLKEEKAGDVETAVRIVQSLDPIGTCTANYMESLRAQIALLTDAPHKAADALSYLELLQKGKFAEAAKKMKCSEREARNCFAFIKELHPFPGRKFSSDNVRFVVPDVKVIRKDGDFAIILNDEEIPALGINPFFAKTAKGMGNNAARRFAKENIREARWFINAINERNHTLLKVSRAIIQFQREFFEKGPGNLSPLTQQSLAYELEIHESTVSRIANGKYIQTEWGIFALKYFFTNSINRYGGQTSLVSKESAKMKIRELIKNEERRLSDQEIANRLAAQGVPLARRTVAKYRAELDMGSSYTR
jgi:RNA polymerase sigma-54 factor